MISKEWLVKHYPEWVNNNDEDVQDALKTATNAIKPALFCQDGRLTHCLRVRMKEFLRDYGVDVLAYDKDYYRSGGSCADDFIYELGLIHLARHIIMQHKIEYNISRSCSTRVYADHAIDAVNRAKDVYPPTSSSFTVERVAVDG